MELTPDRFSIPMLLLAVVFFFGAANIADAGDEITWNVNEKEYLVYENGQGDLFDPLWYEVNSEVPTPHLVTRPEQIPIYVSFLLPDRFISKPAGGETEYRFKKRIPAFNPVSPTHVVIQGARKSNTAVDGKDVIHLRHKIKLANQIPRNVTCRKCEGMSSYYFGPQKGTVTADIYYDPQLNGIRKVEYDADIKLKPVKASGEGKTLNESGTFTLTRHHEIGSGDFNTRVSDAIDSGVDFLANWVKQQGGWSSVPGNPVGKEIFDYGNHTLVLLTLLEMDNEDVSRDSDLIKNGLKYLFDKTNFEKPEKKENGTGTVSVQEALPLKMKRTYTVALAMMVMDAYYASPHQHIDSKHLLEGRAPGSGGGVDAPPMRPEDRGWIVKALKWLVQHQKQGRWTYPGKINNRLDNSNAQYGALGFYAALQSGLKTPPAILKKAVRAWAKLQQKNGPSVRVGTARLGKSETGVVNNTRARGWAYSGAILKPKRNIIYGSIDAPRMHMTTGGYGSLTIYKQYLQKMNRLDARTKRIIEAAKQDALGWMVRNWTLRPYSWPGGMGNHNNWNLRQYYGLYALERAGMLDNIGMIGSHRWYPEGAELILSRQENGRWGSGDFSKKHEAVVSTCFALLFLKRATNTIVETGK